MRSAVTENRGNLCSLIAAVTIVFLAAAERSAGAGASPRDAGQTSRHDRGRLVVGHATRILNVTGTLGETRPVNVHLWYPAHRLNACDTSSDLERNTDDHGCAVTPSVYTSRLNGIPLTPQWDALSWAIGSSVSFENLPIARGRRRFPVIVFSHGHQNNAIDYVYTLEALASAGFIVAAPDHLNGTQDDVRIDFINSQAGGTVIPCFDGRPSPCAHPDGPLQDVSRSMIDRMHDITAVLDALSTWFGNRVDLSRVGILGHSRGTVSALAAAGGSTMWGFGPILDDGNPRVKAIMGLAIGVHDITFGANLEGVTAPTLLVAGALDSTEPVSLEAYAALASTEKAVVLIDGGDLTHAADHRHFDSGLCAQVQSAGGIAATNPRAILDLQTLRGVVIAPLHRRAMDFCGFETFANPTDPTDHSLADLIASLTGFTITPDNVPATGIDSDEVKDRVVELAVIFFQQALQ